MRKWIMVTAALLGASLLNAGAQIYSQNAVGYTKITIPPNGNVTMVGINYEKSDSGNKKLSEFFGSGTLRGNDFDLLADKVYLWDNSQYAIYYKNTAGDFVMLSGSEADPELPPGTSVWLQSPLAGASTPYHIYLHGQVKTDASATLFVNQGINMVANPYPTEQLLSDTDWQNDVVNAAANDFDLLADKVYIWDPTANGGVGGYLIYYLDASFNWVLISPVGPLTPTIPSGGGYWYVTAFYGSPGNVTWTVTRPFDYP